LLVEADLPPHMVQTFRTLGFHAPAARKPQRSLDQGSVERS
jgi:hypothetical protein